MAKSTAIPQEMIEDMPFGSGIAYWAIQADWDNAPKGKARDKVVCGFREAESEKDFFLTATDVRKAIRALASLQQEFVCKSIHDYFINAYRDADENGIDAGWIDSIAADCIVQVAAFGKIIYG